MNSADANNPVVAKHLENLANAAKNYTLAALASVGGGASYSDFTGATSIAGGLSGLVPAPAVGDQDKFLRGDGLWASVSGGEYTAGYGLSLADGEFSVTLEGGGLSANVIDNVNEFFSPRDEFKDRYAEAPFDAENIFGLDLSHLVDGTNFELDTDNLTDGKVTRIRSGSASYNVNSGISRGYIEVKTLCKCTLTVTYSISSQASYDFGGCIVTTDAPNTAFTYANLKAANFFYKAGKYSNQTATYTLAANTTYYLNFGYAKNASTNTADDRFYIHSIRIVPEVSASCLADYFFDIASDFADCVVGGIGGKFLPSASSMAKVVQFGGNFSLMEHKIKRILENPPQYAAQWYSDVTLCGGEVVASIHDDGTAHSLVSSMNDTTQYVTLVSDTSSVTNIYKICPLTDSGGFIYRDATNTVGYGAGISIQPFVITSTGKPSLGSATSILGAQSASYPQQYWSFGRSLFDPTNIVFFLKQETANGFDYKYTSIAFQGNGVGLTRTANLTTLGTEYINVSANGKTSLFNNWWDNFKNLSLSTSGNNIKIQCASTIVHAFTPCKLFGLNTYNSSGEITATTYKLLVNHGLYHAAPTLMTLTGAPNTNLCGIWKSKSNLRASHYIVCQGNTTVAYSDTWWKNLCTIYVCDFTSNRLIQTSWHLGDVIDDFAV